MPHKVFDPTSGNYSARQLLNQNSSYNLFTSHAPSPAMSTVQKKDKKSRAFLSPTGTKSYINSTAENSNSALLVDNSGSIQVANGQEVHGSKSAITQIFGHQNLASPADDQHSQQDALNKIISLNKDSKESSV